MTLRKGQKELVEQYRGGYCAVPAIPGGGKTHCLSQWAVEMIISGNLKSSLPENTNKLELQETLNKREKSGKILIVTYMNSAVNNIKQRISKELLERGVVGSKDYFVSTIHGLCLQIIKEKPDILMTNEEFEIIDGVSKTYLINNSIDEWRKKNNSIFSWYIEQTQLSSNKIAETNKKWQEKLCSIVLSAVGDFKTRGITAKEAKEKCKILNSNSLLKCCTDIYEIYDVKLKMGGFIDFDDMLFNAKRLLTEDEKLLEKYRKKYTFVCEDEAQDSNQIQSDILTLIANGNLLRVGDSNQAICGSFSNSDFTLFKDFCEMPQTKVYNITQSSRNTLEIIDFANYFVNYVRSSHPVLECRNSLLHQMIEPVGKDDSWKNPVIPETGLNLKIFSSWEEEAENVVSKVGIMMKRFPNKTFAVLIPMSWKIAMVVKMMENRRIPFEEMDNTSSEKNKTVRKLGRVIDFVSTPENGNKLSEMMNECFLTDVYMEEENTETKITTQREILSRFLSEYSTEKLLYPMGGEIDLSDVPQELLKTKIWVDFTSKIALLRELLEFPATVIEKLILYVSEKLNFDREERAIAQKVAGDVRYLMSQDLHWRLADLALELLNTKNIFNFFAGIVWDLKGYEPKPGVVTLATYHKSKGLEWDVVFLTSLNSTDFPVELKDKFIGEYWFLKQEYKNPLAIVKSEIKLILEDIVDVDSVLESKLETISEKARLLYVGITRAKEYLYLSGFHANPGKKNEVLPSKYLIEIKKYIEDGEKC